MNEQQLARFEARLERLVEGVFTNLFHKSLSAHDIALKLVRGMENDLRQPPEGDDQRLLAPDEYVIYVHPDVLNTLNDQRPKLAEMLEQQILELAAQANYRLLTSPLCKLVASDKLGTAEVHVKTAHSKHTGSSTAVFNSIKAAKATAGPLNPQLVINGDRIVPLEKTMISIGRSAENDVIIDDPYLSRQHAQIRLRSGYHILFDVHSKGGTFVNNVAINEHKLQPGDVIRIGNTQLIYMVDDDNGSSAATTTASMDPVDF